jgi:hypothetical protein
MVSDLVLINELPPELRSSITAYVGCVSGADIRGTYLERISKAGFEGVEIVNESSFPLDCLANDTTIETLLKETGMTREGLAIALDGVTSIKVSAFKPNSELQE